MTLIATFILGSVFGSWAACMGYRIPRGISTWGRSECPECGHKLSAFDLIPVLGYFLVRGKCRYCGVKINPVYLLPEVSLAILYTVLFMLLGPTTKYLMYIVLITIMAIISVSDMETHLIPDKLVVILAVMALPFIYLGEIHIAEAIYGFVVGFTALLLPGLISKQSFGGGDVKLSGVLGVYLGPYGVMTVLLTAVGTALLYQVCKGMKQRNTPFPFAPFLFLGTVSAMIIKIC